MSKAGRATARFRAVQQAATRRSARFSRIKNADGSFTQASDYFGCNTFGFDLMARKLPPADVAKLKAFATSSTEKLPLELADKVALAVKDWALSRGATHYCHWFQPQTGATAEKHDAFFSLDGNGKALENFNGLLLSRAEPDASSFPSGGIRSTFEARGYTIWDASSPMFLMETDNGTTLCIPSLFISYTNQALDNKTPLLRSLRAINDSSTEAISLLGDHATHVMVNIGAEQEYFVIDEDLFVLRPDLVLSGRTLLGRVPPRHQQLDDHYFGSIKARVLNYMMECETELYKLGVPCKTRHNEVAPAQYEVAPIHESANVAADHNQLLMEIHKSVARKHGLVALFHEKPYASINGSGKHINWSIMDEKGNNLLKPGPRPFENIRFLYFLTAVLRAISEYGNVLRMSVASAGNDFRLGANEAPPAIMSVFLGKTLTDVAEQLVSGVKNGEKAEAAEIDMQLARVPVIKRDNTDRNRTSPFAFTGNRFEFRAQGSSGSIAPAVAYLNAAVAAALQSMNDELKAFDAKPNLDQVFQVIKRNLKEHRKVVFNGNGYSTDWHKEAERRGLPNLKNTVQALAALKDAKVIKMLSEQGIHCEQEIRSRYNVNIERYNKIRLIELETLQEMVATHVYPGAMLQLHQFANSAQATKDVLGKAPEMLIKDMRILSDLTDKLAAKKFELDNFIDECHKIEDEEELAHKLADNGMTIMEDLRLTSNELELLVDDNIWSLPKYREMLYHF